MDHLIIGPAGAADRCARAFGALGLDARVGPAADITQGGNAIVLPPEGGAATALTARFEATRAAVVGGARLVLQLVPVAGVLATDEAPAGMAALALSRSTALDLRDADVRSHAIAVETPLDVAHVAALTAAIGRCPTLVSGQVFACTQNRIALLSQPRPIRVASTPYEGWRDADIGSLLGPMWRDAFHATGSVA